MCLYLSTIINYMYPAISSITTFRNDTAISSYGVSMFFVRFLFETSMFAATYERQQIDFFQPSGNLILQPLTL